MGTVDVKGRGIFYDVEETIFVAVGKSVKKSRNTIFWTLHNFAGKKISLLYVHQPIHKALTNGELATTEQKLCNMEALHEVDKQKVQEVFDQYDSLLVQEEVKVNKIWTAVNNVEEGILEIIGDLHIRWLVMGAAADKYYSKKLTELKSQKAMFVCQQAPISCHIWFSCKGCLIYTRPGRKERSDEELDLPLLLLNTETEREEAQQSRLEPISSQNADEDPDRVVQMVSSQFSLQPSSGKSMARSSKSNFLLENEEEETSHFTPIDTTYKLEWYSTGEDSEQNACHFMVKSRKEVDNTMKARCKAKALELLCAKKMCRRLELEEKLAIKQQEGERLKSQCAELTKELNVVQRQQEVMKDQILDSESMVKELEEKTVKAVELLVSFRKQRDVLQIEYENATMEAKKLRNLLSLEDACLSKPQILTFSFSEINEATHSFDPSWKMGDSTRYGSIYKGILRHMQVAIRMLPSHGSQSDMQFLHQVQVLSRVRHPNLVMLIGTCPESRSVIHEYLTHGSLDDHLASRGNTGPLTWQTRLKVAIQLCSALNFLHCNKPCIIHGNIRPSRVLLDANYACKLSDLGLSHLTPENKNPYNVAKVCNEVSPSISIFMDPNYLETGKLTPESDIYSLGIILLVLLTNRRNSGILKDVKCALEEGNLSSLLDYTAGDWPIDLAKQLASLALSCCKKKHINLSDIWSLLEALRASFMLSSSCSDSQETRGVPSHFVCPILQEVMKDPQIAADGYTYEGEAIRGWFNSGHNTSPMTNLKLEHCNLIPNHTLHYAILEWSQKL